MDEASEKDYWNWISDLGELDLILTNTKPFEYSFIEYPAKTPWDEPIDEATFADWASTYTGNFIQIPNTYNPEDYWPHDRYAR